jgi:hypothetical protein
MTFSIITLCHYAEYHFAAVSLIVILIVIMLRVKMLNVIMLSVAVPFIEILSEYPDSFSKLDLFSALAKIVYSCGMF